MDRLQRFRVPIMLVLTGVAGLVAYGVLRPAATAAPAVVITLRPTSAASPTAEQPATIRVYVSGAVKKPDVYSLPPGSIVKDALSAAGGPAEDADLDRINLAARVNDGMQVHFPRKGEPAAAPGSPGAAPASGPLDVNTATLEQLDALPGVGPAIAQRIIDYRAEHGPFTAVDQLKDVKGVGDALFEKIKDLVTIGP